MVSRAENKKKERSVVKRATCKYLMMTNPAWFHLYRSNYPRRGDIFTVLPAINNRIATKSIIECRPKSHLVKKSEIR